MNLTHVIAEREVEADRTEILTKLRENRAAHEKEHEKAVAAFPQAMKNAVIAWREDVSKLQTNGEPDDLERAARKVQRKLDLPDEPQSYTHVYDEMIELLEIETRDTITLSGREVRALVYDKWDWKEAVALANAKVIAYSRSVGHARR